MAEEQGLGNKQRPVTRSRAAACSWGPAAAKFLNNVGRSKAAATSAVGGASQPTPA